MLTSEVVISTAVDPRPPFISGSVGAGLVIVPTFDSSITGDAINGSAIMAEINAAIAEYQVLFSDNITVNITFQKGGGLGGSSSYVNSISYPTYRAALLANSTTSDDTTALGTLPIQATSPVDGQANIWVTMANQRAIGLIGAPSGPDGIITLNTAIMNLNRITIDPLKYDLKSVTQHEIDEVLGLGSGLNLPANFPRQSRPQDLFRYSAPGVRSYTLGFGGSFLSINGGGANLAGFGDGASGSDYGDWNSDSVRVNNAFGTPGAIPNLATPELTNLDVIGYTPAVPEANSLAAVGVGALVLSGYTLIRRKRQSR
ncbi:MAG: hypothetical protein EXS36_02220 [Pedosphaera sp.]|nr:hypothetical protein [Pedosphaera sp.]